MKKRVIIGTLALLITGFVYAEDPEKNAVKATIVAFAKAADSNDASKLDNYLDENYRIVMNRMFGSKQVDVMPKPVYLEKIRSKEFGGDSRQLKFEMIMINGNTAMAKVVFTGSKMSFTSFLNLVKNESGDWKLVSEIPVMI